MGTVENADQNGMKTTVLNKLKRIDLILLLVLLSFLAISTTLVYSATLDDPFITFDVNKIAAIYGFALLSFYALMWVNFRFLLKVGPYIYALGIALILIVDVVGARINGARSWFQLPGGLQFQPAELMKLLLLVALASWIGRREGKPLRFWKDVVPCTIMVLLPFLLVAMQPDLGNAMIYLVLLVSMLWMGQMRYLHVLICLLVGGLLTAGAWWGYTNYHDQVKQQFAAHGKAHWVARVDTFLYPKAAGGDV